MDEDLFNVLLIMGIICLVFAVIVVISVNIGGLQQGICLQQINDIVNISQTFREELISTCMMK